MNLVQETGGEKIIVAVLISAGEEWIAALHEFNDPPQNPSPIGDYFTISLAGHNCLFYHGGWGKVSAAATTQYVIDRWRPDLLINLGTCGGLEGHISVGEVVLASETLIYDIYERMGDPQSALDHYSTRIDLSCLRPPYPHDVRVSRLVSGDQDIDPAMVELLKRDFHAIAADWESGAIAWVASRNGTRVLILRVVSDMVGVTGGEIYERGDFAGRAAKVMQPLLRALPDWIRCAFPIDKNTGA